MFNAAPYSRRITGEHRIHQFAHRVVLYFALSSLATKLSGFIRSLQACLAKRAWLKALISLNPMPPMDFGNIILSHATHAIFLLPASTPHQYCLMSRVNSSQTDMGNLNTLIMYVGIAYATAFIKISLLAIDMYFSLQSTSLFASFASKGCNILCSFCLLEPVSPSTLGQTPPVLYQECS